MALAIDLCSKHKPNTRRQPTTAKTTLVDIIRLTPIYTSIHVTLEFVMAYTKPSFPTEALPLFYTEDF